MLINILISTIDEGIKRVGKVLLEPRSDLKYYVSHQFTEEKYRQIPEQLRRDDLFVGQIEGRGLCRNRNNSLSMTDGDVAILADDDVRYRPEYIDMVKREFESDDEMAVGCFKIVTPAGDPEYKDYTEHTYLLNQETHHYISTLEIVFRPAEIKKKMIFFDERFGLGSALNSFGEEAVFIHDCIRAGLKVKYIPEYLVEHPASSTIKSIKRFAMINNVFKGAYDARRYGWPAIPAALYDSFRYRVELAEQGKRRSEYLRERLQGVRYILRK
jgi:glycosyltransferase involved in cell wall biosynthesis